MGYLKEQLKNMKSLIKLNINSISNLVDQTENLQLIIQSMKKSNDQLNYEKLITLRNFMVDTINKLISDTHSLVKSYDDLIEAIVEKLK